MTVKELNIGKGVGFVDEQGIACMIRCFECGKENWMPAVRSGKCAWCSHDPNKEGWKMDRQCE